MSEWEGESQQSSVITLRQGPLKEALPAERKEEGFCILKCHPDPRLLSTCYLSGLFQNTAQRGEEKRERKKKKGKRQKANTAGGNIQEKQEEETDAEL